MLLHVIVNTCHKKWKLAINLSYTIYPISLLTFITYGSMNQKNLTMNYILQIM